MKEQVLKQSQLFWKGLEKADTAAMRSVCDDKCIFVHIGGNCDLDKEIVRSSLLYSVTYSPSPPQTRRVAVAIRSSSGIFLLSFTHWR